MLYLSKNSLRTLHGLQQFACLRVLSAGDNLLDSFEELVWLKPPRGACQLEALSLEGNPLSRLPNYRCAACHSTGAAQSVSPGGDPMSRMPDTVALPLFHRGAGSA